jgi:hypothetical protein
MTQKVVVSAPRKRLASFVGFIAAAGVAVCVALLVTATSAGAATSSSDSGAATPTGAEPSAAGSGIQPLTTYNDSHEYDGQNWTGNPYHIYSSSPCWQGGGVGINQLTGWNNRIRSYSIDSSCRENHYDLTCEGGINTGYQSGAIASMGATAQKTSSMWFLAI